MAEKNKNTRNMPKILALLRKIFTLNIGTIVFGILLLYMIFSAILYMTSPHYTPYQVISGPLSRNETYTGLAIREETVISADSGGYVTYYARAGNKVNANGAVYALSNTKAPETETTLSVEDLEKIRLQMSGFSSSFNSSNFNATYSFKYELEGNILQYAGATDNTASTSTSESTSSGTYTVNTVTLGGQSIWKAPTDGIVLYSKDGYEGKTLESITTEDFNQTAYRETDLKTQESVQAGDDIYTLITNEKWYLVIPLTTKQEVALADRDTIRVKFLKDGMTQSGDFEIRDIDGGIYGVLSFEKGLIRYASDRFLEIELVTNTLTGLKIPLSSIVTKEFYKVPAEYLTNGEDGGTVGFLRKSKKSGEEQPSFVQATIYGKAVASTNEETGEESYYYYVDKNVFSEGDILVDDETNETFLIGKTGNLDGVYCINKGYAVFRCVQILDQNEEFAIVDDETDYGLVRYDHIIQDASQVTDDAAL